MKFSESELADLRAVQEICKRPLQCPGRPMGHEDVPRSPDGLPIVTIDETRPYNQECPIMKRHLACPHRLHRLLCQVAILLEEPNPNTTGHCLIEQLQAAEQQSTNIDTRMRMARTNTEGPSQLKNVHIPDLATAQQNAAPIEAEFEEFCRRLEPTRARLLELIEEALS